MRLISLGRMQSSGELVVYSSARWDPKIIMLKYRYVPSWRTEEPLQRNWPLLFSLSTGLLFWCQVISILAVPRTFFSKIFHIQSVMTGGFIWPMHIQLNLHAYIYIYIYIYTPRLAPWPIATPGAKIKHWKFYNYATEQYVDLASYYSAELVFSCSPIFHHRHTSHKTATCNHT